MRSPLRLFNAWIDHQRLAERRYQVEWQLGIVFKQRIRLRPTLSGGGFDRIYLAHGDDEGEGNSSTSSLAEGDVMLEDEREFPVEEIPSLVAVERDFDFP